jgi:hypothetical protein
MKIKQALNAVTAAMEIVTPNSCPYDFAPGFIILLLLWRMSRVECWFSNVSANIAIAIFRINVFGSFWFSLYNSCSRRWNGRRLWLDETEERERGCSVLASNLLLSSVQSTPHSRLPAQREIYIYKGFQTHSKTREIFLQSSQCCEAGKYGHRFRRYRKQ